MQQDQLMQQGAISAAIQGSEVDQDALIANSQVEELQRRYRFAPPAPPAVPLVADPDRPDADVISLANWVAQVNAMMGGDG